MIYELTKRYIQRGTLMVRNVRQYSKEYKQEAVHLALDYGNVNHVSKEFGVLGPTRLMTSEGREVLGLLSIQDLLRTGFFLEEGYSFMKQDESISNLTETLAL